MKNLKLITTGIFMFLYCLALTSKAQQICGAAQLHQQRMQTDAQYANFYNNLNAQIAAMTQNQAANKIQPTVITLPVVVHVTHLGEPIGTGTNISDAVIQSGLARFNANYANVNGQGVNMQIQFCLASRDPNGNPTTGITRVDGSVLAGYAANGISGGNDGNPCGSPGDSTVKNLSVWPYFNYINIYSVNKICGGAAGYSGVPGGKFDGAVMNYDVFADVFNTVFEHELGHFLGLAHTQNDNGADADVNCPPNTSPLTQGDFVEDTPPHKTSECTTSTCPLQAGTFLVNSTKNIMSYCFPGSNEWRFTQGQKTRARNLLNTYPGNQLLLSDACNPVVPNDAGIVAIKNPLKATYTTTCTGSPTIVPVVRIKNYGSSALTSASVKYRLDNNSLQTYSWSGSIATGATLDVSLPALAVAFGSHTFTTYTTLPNGSADGYAYNDSSIITFNYQSLANFSATAVSSNSCSGSATGSATVSTYSNTVIKEDFEGATTDWTIVQSYNYVNTTSNWFVGTATANGGGKSIYISNNNGVSNAYNDSVSQQTYFYKDITFPANATNITIKFDWKNNGAYYDDLSLFLVSTDLNPAPYLDIESLNPNGLLGPGLYNQTSWTTQIYTGIDSIAGKTKRLVFRWRSYYDNAANQSPAALDNIIVQYATGVSNPPYTYSWNTSPVKTNATANNLAAGNYTVTVTNAVGCTATAAVTVNSNPAITATTSQTVTACGGSTGTATVNASGGTLVGTTTNLTDWEGTNTWTIVNGTQPNKWFVGTAIAFEGTKSIYVSDDNGVTNHYAASPPWPNLNLTHFYRNFTFPAGVFNIKIEFKYKCFGEFVGDYLKAYLVATSTTPVAGTELASGSITPELNLTNGNYVTQTVTGLDANAGSTKRLVFSWRNDAAIQNQPPPSIDNIAVSYNTTSTYTYLWSNGQTTLTATGLPIGAYTCTITDILGCTITKSVTIINNCTGVTISAGGPTNLCPGGSVVLTSSLTTGNVWSTGATTQSITVTTAGSYSCTNSGNTSNLINVTEQSNPGGITFTGNTNFCNGQSCTLTSAAGNSYLWSNGATTQSTVISGSNGPQTYFCTVTINGCSFTNNIIGVGNVSPSTPTISASGPLTFCSGGSVTLTGNSSPNVSDWLWSNGATTQSIAVTTSGTYTVTASNPICPSSPSAGTTVTVQTCGGVTISAGGATTFCNGGSVQLTSSLATGNVWSTGATTQSITVTTSGNYSCTNGGNTSNTISVIVKPLPSTTTSQTGTVSLCSGSLINGPVSGNAANLDGVDDYISIANNVSTATAFTFEAWIYPITNTSWMRVFDFGNSPGVNMFLAAPSFTGYPRFVINTGSGEQIVESNTALSLNAWHHIAVTITGTTSKIFIDGLLTGTNTTFAYNPASLGATTNNWLGRSQYGDPNFNGYIDEVRFWNVARSLTQIQTNMNKTISATSTGLVAYYRLDESTGTSVLELVSNTSTATANNGAAWLVPSTVPWNAASYLWSNGITTQGINVTTAGTYTVSVTAASGCTATSAPVVVSLVKPKPSATITAGGPTTICTGGSVTLTAPARGNALQFDGNDDYVTCATPIIPTSGNYSILFWAKESVNQTGYREIISQGRKFYIGRDNTGIIRIGDDWLNTGVNWPTDLLWHHYAVTRNSFNTFFYIDGNLVATKGSAIGSPIVVSGTPNLFIIGAQFCVACGENFNGQVDDITIWSTVRTLTQIQTAMNSSVSLTSTGLVAYYKLDEGTGTSTVNVVNNGDAGVLTNGPTWVVPSGLPYNISSYLWSTTASTQSITASTAATYKVTVANNYGCTATATKKVTVSTPGASITVTGSLVLCGGSTVTFTANAGTGLTYQWKKNGVNIGGATNQVYVANSAGTYKVVVTNTYGCTKLSGGKVVTECARFGDVVETSENNLSVYPNPTSDFITVSFDIEDAVADMQIINADGAIVSQKHVASDEGTYEEPLDVSKLSPGMYVILVRRQNGIATKRFVKE